MTAGKANLSLLTDPYATARLRGRDSMREEVLTIIMQWAALPEDQATRDLLWDLADTIKGIKP